eukprot:SAG11_NODE_147_length_14771_cov_3.279648_7_plen_278_part_00
MAVARLPADCAWDCCDDANAPFDQDGDLDVFVANADRENFLHMNDGHASMSRVLGAFGGASNVSSSSATVGDIDGDGDVDILVANLLGAPNEIYLNQGGGLLEPLSGLVSVAGGSFMADGGSSAQIALFDSDGDTDLDVLVLNEGPELNFLYLNQVRGAEDDGFVLTRVSAGAALELGYGGMTAGSFALADIDRDGDTDLLLPCPVGAARDTDLVNSMFLNNGSGNLRAASPLNRSGVEPESGDDSIWFCHCGGAIVVGDIDGVSRVAWPLKPQTGR